MQTEVSEYKASEEEVMRLKSVMGVSEDDDPDVISGAMTEKTAKLSSAIRYGGNYGEMSAVKSAPPPTQLSAGATGAQEEH